MNTVRQPAVAGLFYPGNARELTNEVTQYLRDARRDSDYAEESPKALIVPHAGYMYSGNIAARAYVTLDNIADRIERVVLIGPAHRVRLKGLAITDVQYFRTPLGDIPIDIPATRQLLTLPQVQVMDAAHWQEHSLEVQLPFLQVSLGEFSVVPVVIGDATPSEVDQVIELLWGGPETLVIISSDLSHYLDYETARYIDRSTSEAVEHFRFDLIDFNQACGCIGMQALLRVAKRKGMAVHTLGLCNSGDVAGGRDNVVGYGSWAFTPTAPTPPPT